MADDGEICGHPIPAAKGGPLGETFTLGDQPLVLLTALTSAFGAQTTSSRSTVQPRRRIEPDGSYSNETSGITTVFTALDTRLMFADCIGKLRAFDGNRS